MKLEKIKVHNLFQYSDLEIDFSGNLVGIIGKNGSGKSNFLNALHFAFAGEVPGKTKEQVLKWGEESGYAVVEFDHAGKHGRLERHTPGTKASFKYGDEKAVTGIRAVNEAILNMLGMDKDVFRLVFVKQAELDSILFDQASRREVAFQRMCGLGETNRLHKSLSDLIQQVFSESAGDIDATIAALVIEKENSEKELKDVSARHAMLMDNLKTLGSLEELEQERDRWTTASRLKYALELSEKQFKEDDAKYEQLKARLAELGSSVSVDIVKRAKEALVEEEKKLSALEASEKEYQDCKRRLENNRLTLESIRSSFDEYKNLDGLESQVRAESDALAKGRTLAALYKAALDAINTQEFPVCPICGAAMQSHGLQQLFMDKLASCHVNDESFKLMLEKLEIQRRKASELSGKLATFSDMIKKDGDWLAAHPSVGEATLDGTRTMVSDMRTFVEDLSNKYTEVSQLEWQIRQLASDIGNRKAACKANAEKLDELLVLPIVTYADAEELLNEATATLGKFNALNAEAMAAAGAKISLERRIIGIKQNLEAAERKKANTSVREGAYRTLQDVANWLHYSNGPHKLASRIMDDLTNDTNQFLETLGSPFSVSVDPATLGYVFSMNDGSGPKEPQPAEALSGGQKVLLAVAFRLASYCMFAGKYGLLSLDEPTAYLDDANVANFCTLLESIKSTAVSMDLQILISTHERAVLPYMDSVLDIDKAKE